jgi:hypothetical protein
MSDNDPGPVPGDDEDAPFNVLDPDSVHVRHIDEYGIVTDRTYSAGYRDGLNERSAQLDETRRDLRDLRTAGALLAFGLALLAGRLLMGHDDEDEGAIGDAMHSPRLRYRP